VVHLVLRDSRASVAPSVLSAVVVPRVSSVPLVRWDHVDPRVTGAIVASVDPKAFVERRATLAPVALVETRESKVLVV